VRPSDTLQRASGRWPEILVAIGGITPDQLCAKEGPCPACGGNTRFRWDDDSGDGAWHCSHCGGRNGQGGGGNGVDLLSRLRLGTWGPSALAPTLALVEQEFLGAPPRRRCAESRRSAGPRPPAETPPPRPRPPSEWVAFCRLEAADDLADGETFSPAHAKGGAYVRRWMRWCEGADPDLVAAAVLEGDTIAGAREIPDLDGPPPAATRPAGPTGPMGREEVRRRLAAAVEEGAPRADLEGLLLELAELADTSPSNLRGLLRAVQQEQEAARSVEAEEQRHQAAAAQGQGIGAEMAGLDALFPPSIAASINRLIEYLPVDGIAAGAIFLATAAGVQKLGNEVIASRRLRFRVPTNLYASIVGRSGIKKDPVIAALVTRPMAPIAADLKRAHDRAMEDWRASNLGKKPSERTEQPCPTYLSCTEYTGEALSLQLQRQESQGLGLLVKRSEIKGLFGGMNAYRGGKGSDSEQLLEAYDGLGYSSLRIGAEGGGRFYDRCHLSIFGGIQPEVLEELVKGGDASGLWSRFSFIPIPDRVVPLPTDDSEEEARITQQAEDHLAQVIRNIYRLPRQTLVLDPDARELFVGYEARCQRDAQRAPLNAMRAAWSKAPGKVLRVAGLLHLLHMVSRDGELSELVAAAMVDRASCLIDHLTSWALGIHEAAAGGGEASDLMAQVHRIAQGAGQAIAWRDVAQRLSVRQRSEIDSAAAHAAVAALARLGVGEVGEGKRPGSWSYRATADLPG